MSNEYWDLVRTQWTEERRIVPRPDAPDLSYIKLVRLPVEFDQDSIEALLETFTEEELEALDQWILEQNNTNSPTSETKK